MRLTKEQKARDLVMGKRIAVTAARPSANFFLFDIDDGRISVSINHKGTSCNYQMDLDEYEEKESYYKARGWKTPRRETHALQPRNFECYHILAAKMVLALLTVIEMPIEHIEPKYNSSFEAKQNLKLIRKHYLDEAWKVTTR